MTPSELADLLAKELAEVIGKENASEFSLSVSNEVWIHPSKKKDEWRVAFHGPNDGVDFARSDKLLSASEALGAGRSLIQYHIQPNFR